MTTWGDFLAETRADLDDLSETNPRWSDKLLFIYFKDAVRDYSVWFPKRIDREELTLDSVAYPLPLNFIEDILVECPANTFLEKRRDRPGSVYSSSSRPFYYYIQGGNLYLGSLSDDPVLLTYFAAHELPTSETDTTFVITIPDADTELIRTFVKAKAYERMRSKQSSLDRFKIGTGSRDDNPVEPEVDNLMLLYREGIADRVKGGAVTLYRPGRTL